MRTRLTTSFTALALLLCASVASAEGADLKDPKQKLSYAIGTEIGANLKKQGVDIDPKAFSAGLADALAGKLQMTDAEIKDAMNSARNQLIAKQQAKQQADAAVNAKSGRRISGRQREEGRCEDDRLRSSVQGVEGRHR